MHGLCPPEKNTRFWRAIFLLGLVVGGLSFYLVPPIQFPLRTHYPVYLLIIGGFFVGFGTRMGHGCTSGHGVCGIARLSIPSVIATLAFFLSGAITVFISRHLIGC
ncbi:YeeE/YedE family protein [Legionella sp. 227]|uniref:YeeE/YedE family protein n=1 Tax=Legionella sp. 227 TaxID=3367288 RepID=UPI00370D938F